MARSPNAAALLSFILTLSCLTSLASAKMQRFCEPQLGPKLDPCNPLEYIPSNVLTGIAVGLCLFSGICHLASMWRWGAKWMLAMTIGIFTFSIGLGMRFGLHTNPDAKGTYIVEYLFIVLSPCAFIAADYVLLGRLAIFLGTPEHLVISPRRVTPMFVCSDLVTFLIQAVGGSVSIAANDIKTNKLGSNIFLAGLVLQLFSFLLFTLMYLRFVYRVKTYRPEVWSRGTALNTPWYKDWRALAFALFVSCIGILVRSVFRVIELSQGFKGPLATNEGIFYGLDTLPLFIAVSAYVPFWPGRFIPRVASVQKTDSPRDSESDGPQAEKPSNSNP